jgi:signal transduction histidine kinase
MAYSGRTPAKLAGQVFRHFVFMMIGALLAVPYIAVFIWGTQLAGSPEAGPLSAVVAFILLFLLLVVPALLSVTRALECTAVRELLDVELPEPIGSAAHNRRWRGAAWYLVHLMAGGLTLVAAVFAIPVIVTLSVMPLTGQTRVADQLAAVLSPFADSTTAVLWSLALGAGVIMFTILTGMALRHWAGVMLGPSPAERLALAEQGARVAARRNELARELHDSVGHALTVTTLQATAAQSLLARDPDAAVRAMQAVADTGRAALAELDHVIGILREPDGSTSVLGGGAGSLAELPGYLDVLAGQGLAIERNFDPRRLDSLPPAVSTVAFKILQEGLTNVLKYASPQQCTVRISAEPRMLHLDLSNPVSGVPLLRGGGRGLAGIAERARLAGGSAQTSLAKGIWSLAVSFPLDSGQPDGGQPDGAQSIQGRR